MRSSTGAASPSRPTVRNEEPKRASTMPHGRIPEAAKHTTLKSTTPATLLLVPSALTQETDLDDLTLLRPSAIRSVEHPHRHSAPAEAIHTPATIASLQSNVQAELQAATLELPTATVASLMTTNTQSSSGIVTPEQGFTPLVSQTEPPLQLSPHSSQPDQLPQYAPIAPRSSEKRSPLSSNITSPVISRSTLPPPPPEFGRIIKPPKRIPLLSEYSRVPTGPPPDFFEHVASRSPNVRTLQAEVIDAAVNRLATGTSAVPVPAHLGSGASSETASSDATITYPVSPKVPSAHTVLPGSPARFTSSSVHSTPIQTWPKTLTSVAPAMSPIPRPAASAATPLAQSLPIPAIGPISSSLQESELCASQSDAGSNQSAISSQHTPPRSQTPVSVHASVEDLSVKSRSYKAPHRIDIDDELIRSVSLKVPQSSSLIFEPTTLLMEPKEQQQQVISPSRNLFDFLWKSKHEVPLFVNRLF
jgi:hypothetical protein